MNKFFQFITNIIYGCIIGIANIIPGVSGGTMAVVLNIYDRLIDSVIGIKKHVKESILFLLPVLIGGAAGIFGFAVLLNEYLFKYYPMPTFFLFIGLIVGSLPLVFRKALETKFSPLSVIPMAVFFGIMIGLIFLDPGEKTSADAVTVASFSINIGSWAYLFFGSILAAMCMIIPGVSGSMILMILGLYPTVLGAISYLKQDLMQSAMILLPVGLGVIIGLLGGAKLIDVCLKKVPQMTFFAIIGLMIGSLPTIYLNSVKYNAATITASGADIAQYNYGHFGFDITGIISIATFIIGCGVALIFGSEKLKKFTEKKKAKKKSQTAE